MNRITTTLALLLSFTMVMTGCSQAGPSPCVTPGTTNAVLAELNLARLDAVDGIEPIKPFEYDLKLTDQEQVGPNRLICSAILSLEGTYETVMTTLAAALGDTMQRVAFGLRELESLIQLEIDRLAEAEPDKYAPYDETERAQTESGDYSQLRMTIALPLRYAVDPQQSNVLLGIKYGDDLGKSILAQLHRTIFEQMKRDSRALAEKQKKEAAAAGFDSITEYQSAREEHSQARNNVASLESSLDQAQRDRDSLKQQIQSAKTTLTEAQAHYNELSARHRKFIAGVKAGDSSSHPTILRYSDMRLEQGDRGRVRLRGNVTNVSGKPIEDWVADVYMYRPDLDRIFVSVKKYFWFPRSGHKINAGETKPIKTWVVNFGETDRGGNTTEKVFRDVKPASIHIQHKHIEDTNKRDLIPRDKTLTDLRQLMNKPEKALREAKSKVARLLNEHDATAERITRLTTQLAEAEQAFADLRLSKN